MLQSHIGVALHGISLPPIEGILDNRSFRVTIYDIQKFIFPH